jgi:MFS family permease
MVLWSSQVVSTVGTRVSSIAFPLLVLAVTHSPAGAGVVGFAQTLPFLLLYLPAGAFIDRWDRKRTMLACDAGRAGALGSIAITVAAGWLRWRRWSSGWGRAGASQRLGQPAATLAAGKVILAAGPGTPVYAISPQQMSILRTFHAGTGCDAPPRLAAGQHGLYAIVGSAVVRLDLTTGRIAARGPATGLNVPDSEPLIVALGGLWYTPQGSTGSAPLSGSIRSRSP